jgi:hypothetical protein
MIVASGLVRDAPAGTTLPGQPSSRAPGEALTLRWSRDELDERIELLASANQGDDFVQAIASFAEQELEADERELLGEILLERAEEDHAFEEAIRRRARERGWFRRTRDRLEGLGSRGDVGDTAGRIGAVVAAEERDADAHDAVLADLRADRGRAARVLDELSRHKNPIVRGWVSGTAREVLGEGGVYIVMGLTRDRDPDVRRGAVRDLVELEPDSARRLIPSLRRRLRSRDLEEPIFAMWTLAELGDRGSLPAVARIAAAESDEHPFRRQCARVVALVLGEQPEEIVERIHAHDHELMLWLARAARILGTDEARAALAECAEDAPDEECRNACAAELRAWEVAR